MPPVDTPKALHVHYLDAKKQTIALHVGLTGARDGARLVGTSVDTASVVLRVVGGSLSAPGARRSATEAAVGRDVMVASVARHYGLSKARAAQRYDDTPLAPHAANHRPLGATCNHGAGVGDITCDCPDEARFVIVQPGVWQGFAEGYGHGDVLREMVAQQRAVTWREILALMQTPGHAGGKTLILRPRIFAEHAGPSVLAPDDPRLAEPGAAAAVADVARYLAWPPETDADAEAGHAEGGAEDGAGGDGGDTAEDSHDEHVDSASSPAAVPTSPATSSSTTVSLSASSAPVVEPFTTARVYDIDGNLVRLPPGLPSRLATDDVVDLVLEALAPLPRTARASRALLQTTRDVLAPLTMGGLKSALQKAVRFRAARVALPAAVAGDLPVALVPAPAYAAVACALLFANAGGFIPDLQLFARGSAAAAKRAAVILVEDAWVPGVHGASRLQALLGLALALQDMSDYHAPRSVTRCVVWLCASAAASPYLLDWRGEAPAAGVSARAVQLPLDPTALHNAAHLLRAARSFAGDLSMLDTVAKLAAKGQGHVAGWCAPTAPAVDTVPACHAVDQHAFRGIAHVAGNALGSTFPQRFHRLFHGVTGINPRVHSVDCFETRPLVRAARFAQDAVLRLALRRSLPRAERALPVLPASASVRLDLDPGVLAAGVGPVNVSVGRKRLVVLLGVQVPEDEVVMVKPSRNARDLYGSLTDDERAQAIAEVRARTLPVRSPLLEGTPKAVFDGTQWRVDGRAWTDIVADGVALSVPAHSPPLWASSSASAPGTEPLLTNDDALAEALSARGEGLVVDAPGHVRALAAAVPVEVRLRATASLRQQYDRVALPTPSVQGKLAADQLMAYDGDWDVYRMLVLLARLAPGALRPLQVPRFAVGNAVLLRAVERWLADPAGETRGAEVKEEEADELPARAQGEEEETAVQKMETDTAVGDTGEASPPPTTATSSATATTALSPWATDRAWMPMQSAETQLMEHQRAALARMEQRDGNRNVPGHFVVMDTGLGKTITACCYAFRWLCRHGTDVDHLLWVTPAGTVENLVAQLARQWRVPVHLVPRVTERKAARKGSTRKPAVSARRRAPRKAVQRKPSASLSAELQAAEDEAVLAARTTRTTRAGRTGTADPGPQRGRKAPKRSQRKAVLSDRDSADDDSDYDPTADVVAETAALAADAADVEATLLAGMEVAEETDMASVATAPRSRVSHASDANNVDDANQANDDANDDTDGVQLRAHHINVIHADHLRTAIDRGLAARAPRMFIVFDEVDKMYAVSLRTSAARRLAQLCPKFVAQTATPMGRNEAHLLNWLADTENYPVTKDNLLVAASGMVSMQLELNIAALEEDVVVPMVDPVRQAYRELSRARNWQAMAAVTQAHTDEAMCQRAAQLAAADRKQHPTGGVLLVADSLAHSARLLAQLSDLGVVAGGFETLDAPDAGRVAVVVVPKDKDRGYNGAVRLGALVTGVYAGNASSRHQMRGRIRRIGQVRREVRYVTVYMAHSLLELLHQRHNAVDTMNMSLEQLGQHFGAAVLERALAPHGQGEDEATKE